MTPRPLLLLVGMASVLALASCGDSGTGSLVQKQVREAKATAIPDSASYVPQDANYYGVAKARAPGAAQLNRLGLLAESQSLDKANSAGESLVPIRNSAVVHGIDSSAIVLLATAPSLLKWRELEPTVKSTWAFWGDQGGFVSLLSVTDSAGVSRWLTDVGATRQQPFRAFTIYALAKTGATFAIDSTRMFILYPLATGGAAALLKAALAAHSGALPSLAADPGFMAAVSLADQAAPAWEWLRGGTLTTSLGLSSTDSPVVDAAVRAMLGDGDVVETSTWQNGNVRVSLVGSRIGAYSGYGRPWSFSGFRQSTKDTSLALRVSSIGAALPALLSPLEAQYPGIAAHSTEIADALSGGLEGNLSGLGYRVTLIPHEIVQASNYLNQLNSSSAMQHTFSDGGQLSVAIRNGTLEVVHSAPAPQSVGLSDALVAAAYVPAEIQAAVYLDLAAIGRQRRLRSNGAFRTSWADRLGQMLVVAYARADRRPEVDLTAEVGQP